jgi:flagellar motility protein MotE (MotC chaperone)
MSFFIWFLFTVLGCAVGASITSVLIREKLKKESGQQKLEREAERVGYADQIQDLRTKMNGVREESKGYWDDLQEEQKTLEEERQSLEDCMIFVQGSPYLPGRVVRDLMRHEKEDPS